MKLARIGSAGPEWGPADLSGAGAASSPGRWNKKGELVLYAAPTLAMAVLETAAHIDDSGLPLNKYVIDIDIPDDIWTTRHVFTLDGLPVGWDAVPCGMSSVHTGSAWYGARASALLQAPSVIVPEETIIVINAQHPDAHRITARAIRRFQYNLLFRPRT